MELARNDKSRLAIEEFFDSYLYQYDWLEFTDFEISSVTEKEDGTFLVDCSARAYYTKAVRAEDDWDEDWAEMEAIFSVTMEDGEVAEVEAKSRTFYKLPEGC